MDFKYNLEETLIERFEGERDEMMDIAEHGCMSGFDGFIYTYEINEFFNEFESEIENYYYEIFGDSWMIDSNAAECDSMDSMRAHLVWGLIEMWCHGKLDELEEAMLEEMREED